MFRNILIPTDGSPLAARGVKAGVRLARALGAKARRCDAIVMASHGRGGLGGLILGSETTHVLANSKIPVLVVR